MHLRLFAINLEKFRIVFSAGALRQTVLCFTIIFFIVMLFNIRSVTNVKLIDLLTDSRKNESMQTENRILPVCLFLLSLLCIGISAALFNKNGILPSHENNLFQLAAAALVAGTFLLFYSLSAVFMQAASARKCFYLKGLNTFLVRQIGSKIRTNYLVVTVVCGLLTITICAVSIGASTALAMNKMSQSATPYDLNVLSNVSVDGDSDIAAYLAAHDITISNYAKATEQISVYEADMTYSELFEGQKVKFWPIDEKVPDSKVSVISISDLNRALAMQNKAPITLNDGQYLLNCNYNGTYRYIAAALQSHPEITVGGATLQRAEDNVLQETYIMTSVGNNDRGTLIVPDSVTASLEKDVNALLVQYEPNADSNEILQKMIPIGLDSTHGYRYAEKNMMYETFYGLMLGELSLPLYRVGLFADLRRTSSVKTAYRNDRQCVSLWLAAKAGCRPQANRSYAFCADSRVLCHSASRCWRVFCFPDWQSNGCGGRIYEYPYRNQYRTDNRSFSACLRKLFLCNVSFL